MASEAEFLDFVYRNGKNVANKQTKMDIFWEVAKKFGNIKHCRFCRLFVDETDAVGVKAYWVVSDTRADDWYVSHASCQAEGLQKEIEMCKEIDAACTDCKFFSRKNGIYGICTNVDSPRNSEIFPSWGNTAEGNKCWISRSKTSR